MGMKAIYYLADLILNLYVGVAVMFTNEVFVDYPNCCNECFSNLSSHENLWSSYLDHLLVSAASVLSY